MIAQTLGHFALGHHDPVDFEGYVRQRVEANYFAGALLAPETAVVSVLGDAKGREDISVEDLNEVFYISYEMAAHRLTNLITRHFDIPIHFQRSDPEGLLWKAYENDGVLLPADADGTIEGQRVCRWWSARQAFESEDSYSLHYQYTDDRGGHLLVRHPHRGRARAGRRRHGRHHRGARPLVPGLRHHPPGRVTLPRPDVLPAPVARRRAPVGRGGLALGPRPQPLRVGAADRHGGVQPVPRGGHDRRVLVPRPPPGTDAALPVPTDPLPKEAASQGAERPAARQSRHVPWRAKWRGSRAKP